MAENLSLDELPDLLAPGMRVFVPGASNEPLGLLEGIRAQPDCAEGVTFTQFPFPGLNRTDFAALHPDARMECFFLSADIRKSFEAGRVRFLPMHMRRIYDYLAAGEPFDVVLLQLGMDAHGRYRHGPNLDFVEAVLGSAHMVIAEVNRALEPPAGAPEVPLEAIDLIVETDHPLPELPMPEPDAASRAIGRSVARLVPDGACIQTGIGAIPAAVLDALAEHNDLGIHGGLLDDGGLALIERGVVTGECKAIDKGRHVVGMALGGPRLYNALAERSDVLFRPARYTHEAMVIQELDDFISINSAVQVDLMGQVNAEMVGGRQISGTGGAVDFMRAAAGCPGGRSIVALTATARGGELSRVVPALDTGAVATAPRTDVDLVVTEHGVAELKGRSVDERAQALIQVAAPQFRDELKEAWRERRARM